MKFIVTLAASLGAVSVLYPSLARAHEPLWGETPQTFAFGVIHPELRLARGESRFSVQYAPKTTENLKLEVVQRGAAGAPDEIFLTQKRRTRATFGPDFKQMEALVVGTALNRPGFQLGYAFAHERLTDTIWASALHTSTRNERMTELDAAYGYWLKRARTPADHGFLIALGGHHEALRTSSLTGVHTSLILTKGPTQTRVGLLFPSKGPAQLRFGLEALL